MTSATASGETEDSFIADLSSRACYRADQDRRPLQARTASLPIFYAESAIFWGTACSVPASAATILQMCIWYFMGHRLYQCRLRLDVLNFVVELVML